MNRYAGSNWIETIGYGKDISAVGKAAADLLGDVFLGIYHLNIASLKKVKWSDPDIIEVTIDDPLSTIDDDLLTRIVVLAHDRMLRVSIRGVGPGYMRLIISQRHQRDGELWHRCPTMEDHATTIREHYEQVPA